MSAKNNLEDVLRDIHVLISKGEAYQGSTTKIIVEKQEIIDLLNRLNAAIYEVMDEYELTKQSRDRAEREARREVENIKFRTSRQAEDIYAASILYTNEALSRVQSILLDSTNRFKDLCKETEEKLKEERETVRGNQSELRGQLQDMIDTRKYLRILEERNKQIEKEIKEEKEGEAAAKKEEAAKPKIKPEIRINPEYFEKIGKPLELPEEEGEEMTQPKREFSSIEEAMNAAGEKKPEHFPWFKKEKKTT